MDRGGHGAHGPAPPCRDRGSCGRPLPRGIHASGLSKISQSRRSPSLSPMVSLALFNASCSSGGMPTSSSRAWTPRALAAPSPAEEDHADLGRRPWDSEPQTSGKVFSLTQGWKCRMQAVISLRLTRITCRLGLAAKVLAVQASHSTQLVSWLASMSTISAVGVPGVIFLPVPYL